MQICFDDIRLAIITYSEASDVTAIQLRLSAEIRKSTFCTSKPKLTRASSSKQQNLMGLNGYVDTRLLPFPSCPN